MIGGATVQIARTGGILLCIWSLWLAYPKSIPVFAFGKQPGTGCNLNQVQLWSRSGG